MNVVTLAEGFLLFLDFYCMSTDGALISRLALKSLEQAILKTIE